MTEQVNLIPARLKSAVVGGHVTGADQIIDDSAGKTQSEINVEVSEELTNRYTKNETYNKTELNNMITTPEVEYVNVEATDQTTDISDVLPATGAANTIYKIGSWDGTQYDTSKYSEYTWNGSTYVYLTTRDHGVDDVPTPFSDNLVKSSGVAAKMMEHGWINRFDSTKVIFGIDDLYPTVINWKYMTKHKVDGVEFTRFYASTAVNTTTFNFGKTEAVSVTSGTCTLAIRAKSSTVATNKIKIYIVKGGQTTAATAFDIVNSEFRDYYYTFSADSITKVMFEPNSYNDVDISKIYLYDGDKEDCLLDYVLEDTKPEITTNLLSSFIYGRTYDDKWNNNNTYATDLIKVPASGELTFYGFGYALNQVLQIGLYNSSKEYITKFTINVGYTISFYQVDTSIYKYISVQANNVENDKNGFICEGRFPWIESQDLKEKLQNFVSAPNKLYPVGKNKVGVIGENLKFANAGGVYTYINDTNYISTAMIDITNVKDICISGIPASTFSSATVWLVADGFETIVNNYSLLSDGNEFGGVITNTSAVALIVSMQHSSENYDISQLQIEFNSRKTSYEATIFGIKDIYGIPIMTGNQSDISKYPLIGTTFIFGDSITATNTNSVLMGDPEEYTNSIRTISYVPSLMSKLDINSWYNFALGGAVWTDNPEAKAELGDFAWMSTQVQKAISFSNTSGKIPDLILIAMGANNAFGGDYKEEFDRVMYNPTAQFGYTGIPIENLDRTVLAEAIRWNLHKLEEAFPSAVKMVILPPQAGNRDYVDDEKIKLISIFAKAYGMETIETAALSGIVRQFETTGQEGGVWVHTRDLADQVHPNTNGQFKEVRLYANKIRSRFLY